jgi:hypothetical protein
MSILIFIVALIWGSLAAQFFIQTIISFIIASLYVVALAFSRVKRTLESYRRPSLLRSNNYVCCFVPRRKLAF